MGRSMDKQRKMAMLSKIEVKMTGEFADVKICGKIATGKNT